MRSRSIPRITSINQSAAIWTEKNENKIVREKYSRIGYASLTYSDSFRLLFFILIREYIVEALQRTRTEKEKNIETSINTAHGMYMHSNSSNWLTLPKNTRGILVCMWTTAKFRSHEIECNRRCAPIFSYMLNVYFVYKSICWRLRRAFMCSHCVRTARNRDCFRQLYVIRVIGSLANAVKISNQMFPLF